ncbi:MAG: DMT family transporter [Methanomicrobia archaeon]|nr:DMT family transporter [Methanomicrobia archaeon]
MLGEFLTILSAMIWAFSSIFYKAGLKEMKPTTVNTIRPVVALFFLAGVLIITGNFKEILDLTGRDLLYIVLATIFGLVMGDLLYMFSLRAVGIARTYPISNTYPIFTIFLASLFLGEIVGLKVIFGSILIITAIFLISEKSFDLDIKKGVFFALGASFFWGASMTVMKLAMGSISPLVFSTVRMGIFASFLLIYTMKYEKIEFLKINKSWIIVALGGILDLGVGILLFLKALTYIDVSRAAPLNGTAPIFAIIFAIILTNEKISLRIILGVILSFLGILIIL